MPCLVQSYNASLAHVEVTAFILGGDLLALDAQSTSISPANLAKKPVAGGSGDAKLADMHLFGTSGANASMPMCNEGVRRTVTIHASCSAGIEMGAAKPAVKLIFCAILRTPQSQIITRMAGRCLLVFWESATCLTRISGMTSPTTPHFVYILLGSIPTEYAWQAGCSPTRLALERLRTERKRSVRQAKLEIHIT